MTFVLQSVFFYIFCFSYFFQYYQILDKKQSKAGGFTLAYSSEKYSLSQQERHPSSLSFKIARTKATCEVGVIFFTQCDSTLSL